MFYFHQVNTAFWWKNTLRIFVLLTALCQQALGGKLSQSNLLFVCSSHRDDVGAEFLQVTPQQLHVSGVWGSSIHHKHFVTDVQVEPKPEKKEQHILKNVNLLGRGTERYEGHGQQSGATSWLTHADITSDIHITNNTNHSGILFMLFMKPWCCIFFHHVNALPAISPFITESLASTLLKDPSGQ